MTPTPFDELSEHTVAIQRIASALCGGGAEADDVGQEMWLAAQQRGGAAPVSWGPWLSGAGRRIFWSRRRSESRRRLREQQVAREEGLPSAQERAIRMEVEVRLLQLVRKLPEAQSEVVFLRFWEGLPPREIAKRLNVSVDAVKTRLKRALVKLRQSLSEETAGGRDAWIGALAGLPLTSVPSAGAATTSLSIFGVFMTMKHAALILALSVVGFGIWYSQSDSAEQPATTTESPTVAEAPSDGQESAPELVVQSNSSERAPGVEPEMLVAGPHAVPEDILVITGRVWNIPPGGDRAMATPAVGATVRLGWFLFGMGDEVVPKGLTDQSGSFRLEQKASDYHAQISVAALDDETYAYASEELKWEEGSLKPLQVDVYRTAFSALEGQVVDRSGSPIEGARMVFVVNEEPFRETVSGKFGQFAFPKLTKYGHVLGEIPGWMTVVSPQTKKDESGAWNPIRVVMCESGALRVRVETEEGEPVAGIGIVLDLSRGEPLAQKQGSFGGGYRALQIGETNASGTVRFSEVWAGLKLRLRPSFEGLNFVIERERGGVLVTKPSGEVGQPISLLPKLERQFTLRIKPVRTLKCRVVGPDGAPYPKAHVRVVSDGQDPRVPGTLDIWKTTDIEGRCEIQLISPLPLGRALLTASDVPPKFSPWKPGESPLASSVSLNLDQLLEEELLLTLAPTLKISGKLVDGEGIPLRGRVSVKPIDSELVGRALPTGFAPSVPTSKGGRFIVAGLPKGRYEVSATSSDLAQVVVQDVRAGTKDLVLRMTDQSAAHIDVYFDTGDVPMKQYVTLVGWHIPNPGSKRRFPSLPRDGSYSDPVGWPPDMQGLWYGGGRSAGDNPGTSYWLTPTKVPHKVLNLDPGAYWIGGQARAEDGTLFAQMGTGLVQVDEGDYKVTLQMRPCVELSGHVQGLESVHDLALALALPNGKRLPLNVGRDSMHSIVALGALGDFHLKCVPAGKYELRIGTRKSLELGGALMTRAIDLVPGEPFQLVIDL